MKVDFQVKTTQTKHNCVHFSHTDQHLADQVCFLELLEFKEATRMLLKKLHESFPE